MEMADQELIQRCLNGFPENFRFLVQRYERPLLAYLIHRMGNREQAQEAAQEALVRAYFGLAKLEKPGAFHSWLIGIASRVAMEFFRARQNTHESHEDVSAFPVTSAEDQEEYRLDEAIAALPEGQRQIIILRYYEELSCQEISDRLQMPLGTVTKTLSRAYVGLRVELENDSTIIMEE